MYIRFNYRCPECSLEEERFVKKVEMDAQFCEHHGKKCPRPMIRLPAAPRTNFRFADHKLKPR